MQGYLDRIISSETKKRLQNNPIAAILGPRQCGKSTFAKNYIQNIKNSLYIDLENPVDLNKLDDPLSFFEINTEKLVCLDEIQRRPDLFPALRSIIDKSGKNGQLLILGSASQDLIKQGSETLAGRISYLELTPFLLSEVNKENKSEILYNLWLRGGFPRSYLSDDDESSFQWRYDFVRSFLERDIPQLGFNIPANSMRRLWQMCSHSHGQVLNNSKLGESLSISNHTVRKYIDILEQTFIIRVLYPYEVNLKKRLVKSPKIYIRDSGLLHSILGIETFNDLLGHPVYGSSWEGFVIENILTEFPLWKSSFFRTLSGAEIDLILEKGSNRIAVECKASTAPQVSKGFWNALEDLEISEARVIAPVKDAYSIKKNVMVVPLAHFITEFKK